MSLVADHPGKITPKSGLRHRPIGAAKDVVPITLRSSRLKRKQHEPHTVGGLPSISPAMGPIWCR